MSRRLGFEKVGSGKGQQVEGYASWKIRDGKWNRSERPVGSLGVSTNAKRQKRTSMMDTRPEWTWEVMGSDSICWTICAGRLKRQVDVGTREGRTDENRNGR